MLPRNETCCSCEYFKPGVSTKEPGLGECRRYAPHPVAGPGHGMMILPVWPILREGEWCGDYKRRVEESVIAPLPEPCIEQLPEALAEPLPALAPPPHG